MATLPTYPHAHTHTHTPIPSKLYPGVQALKYVRKVDTQDALTAERDSCARGARGRAQANREHNFP